MNDYSLDIEILKKQLFQYEIPNSMKVQLNRILRTKKSVSARDFYWSLLDFEEEIEKYFIEKEQKEK